MNQVLNPRVLFCCLAVLLLSGQSMAVAEEKEISIAYLAHKPDRAPALSNILPEPEDSGEQGARLGISDSNTTGRFLKHHYEMSVFSSKSIDEVLAEAARLSDAGTRLFVLNADRGALEKLSSVIATESVVFNAGSASNALRAEGCLPRVLHTLPSRAMLTDALGQWLISKKLRRWLLISGAKDEDRAYSDSIKRTARRMGGKIVAEKTWSFDTDLRRTAQKELPVFTQTKEYDMVLVADESGDFGEYVLFNTWYPRPVAGTQGLTPIAWHRVVEQWGAAQLQSRFEKQTSRWMTARDYAAWLAVRSIAEAVTRAGETSAKNIFSYLMSDDFELAAFKGRKLSYRTWNGQLRQPIPLIHPRALVAQAPLEGYLHPVTELDTLGYDRVETKCDVAHSFGKSK